MATNLVIGDLGKVACIIFIAIIPFLLQRHYLILHLQLHLLHICERDAISRYQLLIGGAH